MRITTYTSHINDDEQNFLVKENAVNYANVTRLSSPEDIVDIMVNVFHIDKCSEEYIYMIGVNSHCTPTGFFEISHGIVNASLIQPREVLIRALLSGSVGIFICHNHPGNSPIPSEQDIKLTKRLKEACDLVGIILNDHIIVCRGSYLSLKDANML